MYDRKRGDDIFVLFFLCRKNQCLISHNIVKLLEEFIKYVVKPPTLAVGECQTTERGRYKPEGWKKMARHNDVRLYGYVGDPVEAVKSNLTGEYVRGTFHLVTLQGSRFDGKFAKSAYGVSQDFPMIISLDKDMIAKISKLHRYDVVEIRGVAIARTLPKITYCPFCGEENRVDGNIYFVSPIFLEKRNTEELTEKQAMQEVIKNREISNTATVLGNVCSEVEYHHKDNIETTTYQIAVDRKLFIRSDDPNIKSDFLKVRSFGQSAKMDKLCLIKNTSCVLIDGFLHTRAFRRKLTCSVCGKEYEKNFVTTEIVPYATEYINSAFTDPREALELEEQRKAQEVAEAKMNLFG